MRKWLCLIILSLSMVVATWLLPSEAAPASQPTPTPPVPTWTPGPPPTKTPGQPPTATPGPQPTETAVPAPRPPQPPPAGGFIELRVGLTPSVLWQTIHWQDLWTVVQWKDAWGSWHDVEGWRGELDDAVIGEGGKVVGEKTWWVARSDLGKGPFRWLIYRGEGGRVLAISEPFYLPGTPGKRVMVEVALRP